MKIDPDWKRILRYAWSVRYTALAAVLIGIEVILPLFADDLPRNLFAALSFAAAVAAVLARVLIQPGGKL